MKQCALVCVLIAVLVFPSCTGTKNERKGADMAGRKEKLLVLNADDAGTAADAAEGITVLWKAGAISSASVLAFGDDFEHTAKLLRENGVPTGVHLALNHGTGVLPPEAVPGLHGPDGRLWNTVEETMAHLSIEEAGREFEAQIQKVIGAGLNPGHLDSHMGLVFMSEELLGLYRDLALKYRIAAALPENTWFDGVRKALGDSGLGASVSLDGIYTLPGSGPENLENRAMSYGELLGRLGPGLNHLYSHPAPPTPGIREAFGDADIRNDDYALFLSPRWKEMLEERNIRLAYYSR